MSDQEQELLIKRLIKQFMNDQLEELKNGEREKNNSFVFLEDKTLNMLMMYMLMNWNSKNNKGSESSEDELHIPEEVFNEVDRLIAQNKKDFEQIISLLKE